MNIRTILTELQASGLSDREIARRVGCSQPTVTRLRNGTTKRTNYEYGRSIERLAREVLPSQVIPS